MQDRIAPPPEEVRRSLPPGGRHRIVLAGWEEEPGGHRRLIQLAVEAADGPDAAEDLARAFVGALQRSIGPRPGVAAPAAPAPGPAPVPPTLPAFLTEAYEVAPESEAVSTVHAILGRFAPQPRVRSTRRQAPGSRAPAR